MIRDRGPPIRYLGPDPATPGACFVDRGGLRTKPEILLWGIFSGIADWPSFRANLCRGREVSQIDLHPTAQATTARRITWRRKRGQVFAVNGVQRATWSVVRIEEGTFGTQDSGDRFETQYWLDRATNVLLFSRYEIVRSLVNTAKPDENWNAVELVLAAGARTRNAFPPPLCDGD